MLRPRACHTYGLLRSRLTDILAHFQGSWSVKNPNYSFGAPAMQIQVSWLSEDSYLGQLMLKDPPFRELAELVRERIKELRAKRPV